MPSSSEIYLQCKTVEHMTWRNILSKGKKPQKVWRSGFEWTVTSVTQETGGHIPFETTSHQVDFLPNLNQALQMFLEI